MNHTVAFAVVLTMVISGCAGFPATAIPPTIESVVKLIGALAPPKKEVQEAVGPIRLAAIEKKRAGAKRPGTTIKQLEGLYEVIERDLYLCGAVQKNPPAPSELPDWFRKICDHQKEYLAFAALAKDQRIANLTRQLKTSRMPAVEARQLLEVIKENKLAEFKRSGLRYERVSYYYVLLAHLSGLGVDDKTETFQHVYAGLVEFPDDWNLNGFAADYLLLFHNDPASGVRHMERVLVAAEQGIALAKQASLPEIEARFEIIRAHGLHQLAYLWAEAEGRTEDSGELIARSASEQALKFINAYEGPYKRAFTPIYQHTSALVKLRFARSVEEIEQSMVLFKKALDLEMVNAARSGDFAFLHEIDLHHQEARKTLEEIVKQGVKQAQPEPKPKPPPQPQTQTQPKTP